MDKGGCLLIDIDSPVVPAPDGGERRFTLHVKIGVCHLLGHHRWRSLWLSPLILVGEEHEEDVREVAEKIDDILFLQIDINGEIINENDLLALPVIPDLLTQVLDRGERP